MTEADHTTPSAPEQTEEHNLVHLLTAQREWSEATFGPGPRLDGLLDHIRKELVEVEESHGYLAEWIDVVILALDGAWRTGASPEHVVHCLNQKYAKNRARIWPDWRTADPTKAIEHVRDADDYLDQECRTCGRDNRNDTHDALERCGHLSHPWEPAVAAPVPDDEALELRLSQAIALAYEGYGQAWWTDDSGDVLARVAARVAARLLAQHTAAAVDAALGKAEREIHDSCAGDWQGQTCDTCRRYARIVRALREGQR